MTWIAINWLSHLGSACHSPIGGWGMAVTAIIWLINKWVSVFTHSRGEEIYFALSIIVSPSTLFWGKIITHFSICHKMAISAVHRHPPILWLPDCNQRHPHGLCDCHSELWLCPVPSRSFRIGTPCPGGSELYMGRVPTWWRVEDGPSAKWSGGGAYHAKTSVWTSWVNIMPRPLSGPA